MITNATPLSACRSAGPWGKLLSCTREGRCDMGQLIAQLELDERGLRARGPVVGRGAEWRNGASQKLGRTAHAVSILGGF